MKQKNMHRLNEVVHHWIYQDYYGRIKRLEKERIFCRHQMTHLLDVARIAYIKNLEENLGFEKDVIYTAAVLHDIGKSFQYKWTIPHEVAGEKIAKEIPLVIISNKEKTTTVDAINQDNTVVGRMMARHLLDLGHRDVAFITPPLTRRQWQRTKRVNGFVKEFEKEGLKDHVIIKAADEAIDMQIPRMDSEYSMGYELTMELLDEGREFTAIAGQNDMMAIGALDALHEARIHVPKDVSVIGCDNIFYSGIRKISLTTIDHFVALKGRDACDIILRKIDEQDRFLTDSAPVSLYNIEYTPKLIARRTTGYVRTKKNN